jgi:hypothetical protein
VKLSLIGAGNVFGEDDIINDRPYKATLTCTQNESFVYMVKKSEFFRFFKSCNEGWSALNKISQKKELHKNVIQTNFKMVTNVSLN